MWRSTQSTHNSTWKKPKIALPWSRPFETILVRLQHNVRITTTTTQFTSYADPYTRIQQESTVIFASVSKLFIFLMQSVSVNILQFQNEKSLLYSFEDVALEDSFSNYMERVSDRCIRIEAIALPSLLEALAAKQKLSYFGRKGWNEKWDTAGQYRMREKRREEQ